MNQARYDGLTPKQKKVIDDNSGLAASAWAGGVFDSIIGPYSKLARDRGNTIDVIGAEELKKWEAATAHIDDDWIKDVSAKGADGRKLAAEARALLEKYK